MPEYDDVDDEAGVVVDVDDIEDVLMNGADVLVEEEGATPFVEGNKVRVNWQGRGSLYTGKRSDCTGTCLCKKKSSWIERYFPLDLAGKGNGVTHLPRFFSQA